MMVMLMVLRRVMTMEMKMVMTILLKMVYREDGNDNGNYNSYDKDNGKFKKDKFN